ncbi:Single-stranded-DNA-specific exonuclease RecJ [hydrothermal vent metagenome]|uniref:Single-stranded-DNA-specific exonuclease RecJ n=1 Tax=hydrothermal vent metagenome TaxID=652676 RepID=A0A1W1EHY2_9ZZZZ
MIYKSISLEELKTSLKSRFKDNGFLSLKDLPHPKTLKDMTKATNRIVEAIKNREKIVLIGDYDVDGVVSTTIMKMFFNEIGVELKTIIPNRFRDGYGLSPKIIEKIRDYDLVITVDNGISALEASILAKKLNIELIITDHHIVPNKPPMAHSIINQKQSDCNFPFDEICGAQIAWYLISSLKIALKSKVDTKEYLGVVAIAIIADVMPLLHINRAMVISGLNILKNSSLPAIKALKEHLNKDTLRGDDIGFNIAPLINSAGRMEDASYSLDFLLSSNIYQAKDNLSKLLEFNENRKEVESNITKEVIANVECKDDIIIVYGENWHEGVVGIVASRVSNHFSKPAIILSKNGDILKGSGRSYGECNLFDIVNESKEFLLGFGGHKMAVGLSMDINNFNIFKQNLQKRFKSKNYKEDNIDKSIVGEMKLDLINMDIINILNEFEPYGNENIRPKFISYGVEVLHSDKMGKNREHLKMIVNQKNSYLSAIKFRCEDEVSVGDKIDIIYTINENHFRGETTIQLLVEKIIVCHL